MQTPCRDNHAVLPAPPDDGTSKEVQIALISSEAEDISNLLHKEPDDDTNCSNRFHEEQLKDPALCPIMKYLSEGVLPEDTQVAAKIIVQASLYTMAHGILYYTVGRIIFKDIKFRGYSKFHFR